MRFPAAAAWLLWEFRVPAPVWDRVSALSLDFQRYMPLIHFRRFYISHSWTLIHTNRIWLGVVLQFLFSVVFVLAGQWLGWVSGAGQMGVLFASVVRRIS
jgi:hypothetical protein